MKRAISLVAFLVMTVVAACGDDDTASAPAATPGVDAGGNNIDAGRTQESDSGKVQEDAGGATDADAAPAATFALTLPWANDAAIDAKYTCTGDNGSPAISWTSAPADAKSFAIVMRDTSLTQENNYHWVIYDIPASSTALPASIPRAASPATVPSARQTKWSFTTDYGYGGPCPPAGGAHDYELTLHALNKTLGELANDPPAADTAIKAASIASVKVVGTYKKP